MKLKLGFIVLISLIMTACATSSFKAPCDQHAHFCGSKTKINQW
ncbi:MAG: hypothetical protein P4M12_03005 [Gammaproteobacteria bacterium]|nr:hypothetical protein [Gammaproteobacteria bacterium]